MKLLAAHLALASARWASAPLSELGGVLEPFELCALRHGLTPLAAMESQWARDGGACGLSYPEILRLRGSSSPCYLNTGNKNQACALASPESFSLRWRDDDDDGGGDGEDRRPASTGAPELVASLLGAGYGLLVMWGDSTMSHDFSALLCHAKRNATAQGGGAAAAYASRLVADGACPEAAGAAGEAPLARAPRELDVCDGRARCLAVVFVQVQSLTRDLPWACLERALGRAAAAASARGGARVAHVFNEGHHAHRLEDHRTTIPRLAARLGAWFAARDADGAAAPGASRGAWRESFAQHFGTRAGTGVWDELRSESGRAAPNMTCVGARKYAPRNALVARALLDGGARAGALRLVPTADFTLRRHDLNRLPTDCTHYCWSPLFYEPLLERLGAAFVDDDRAFAARPFVRRARAMVTEVLGPDPPT